MSKLLSQSDARTFFLRHVVLIPGLLAILGTITHLSGIDHALAAAIFDPITGKFPAHDLNMLEMFGHRFAKTAITLVWIVLFAAACRVSFSAKLRKYRAICWSAVAAMGLGPIIVVAMKGMNAYHCPWDLKDFGGYADFATGWFVSAAEAGNCFPSGHASSGFSLIALFFLARQLERERLAKVALYSTLIIGTTFSVIRMFQGAHFLSHNLWAAAICWLVAALCFLPLQRRASVLVVSPSVLPEQI
ncbi:MAG TPA: phosphatase PAP2 family protein [Rhodocyclaceae bacterium]|nr:phosphatase PAP2 family protein [Rhodocyclaceae bacterium]